MMLWDIAAPMIVELPTLHSEQGIPGSGFVPCFVALFIFPYVGLLLILNGVSCSPGCL